MEEKLDRPKPGGMNRGLVALIVIIAVVVIYAVVTKTSAPITEPTGDETASETEEITEEPALEGEQFGGLLPEEWDRFEKATKNIQTLGRDQAIGFYVVADPDNENLVYFASSAYDTTLKENMLSVYRYRLDNDNFERLFRTRYGEGRFPMLESGTPVLHVLGYDSGKLVLLVQDTDDSPGPCTEPLLLGIGEDRGERRNMITMDISDPYGGFEEYTPTQEVIDAAQEAQDSCILNAGM